MKPEISIIVPIYKVQDYLAKCINSILSQSFEDFELILVNDGSPDNCAEICNHYSKIDSRIVVLNKQNGGLSDARNFGINIAKGNYIGFIDSDDWIEPDMYEVLHRLILKYNADIAVCGHYEVENKKIINNEGFSNALNHYNSSQAVAKLLDDDDNVIHHFAWDKLYKRDLFKKVRYPVGKYYEDIFTTHKLLINSSKVVSINSPKYYYLKRNDSITGLMNTEKLYDKFCASLELYKNIKVSNYEYAKLNDIALDKVVKDGIALINFQLRLKEESDCNDYYKNVKLFFKKNITRILLNKSMKKEMKIAGLLLFMNDKIYGFMYKLIVVRSRRVEI
ncbi:glycosyltransferase [Acinetobacter sp. CUI P1]|nr:glycosyltransferase [Acinetobacter sp. CUI P1]